jgi:hypothetical protein
MACWKTRSPLIRSRAPVRSPHSRHSGRAVWRYFHPHLAFRPADRVSLALMIHDKVVAMNFVSEDECLEAFADDPHQCSSIDRFTHLWAEVIHVKLQDNRSLTQVSRRALAFVPRLTPAV